MGGPDAKYQEGVTISWWDAAIAFSHTRAHSQTHMHTQTAPHSHARAHMLIQSACTHTGYIHAYSHPLLAIHTYTHVPAKAGAYSCMSNAPMYTCTPHVLTCASTHPFHTPHRESASFPQGFVSCQVPADLNSQQGLQGEVTPCLIWQLVSGQAQGSGISGPWSPAGCKCELIVLRTGQNSVNSSAPLGIWPGRCFLSLLPGTIETQQKEKIKTKPWPPGYAR